MNKFISTLLVLFALATSVYSQVIVSDEESEPVNISSKMQKLVLEDTDELYFSVIQTQNDIQFSNVDYNQKTHELKFRTDLIVEYIEVYSQDELYMTRLPVFTTNLHLNLENFERGLYTLHLISDIDEEPTITQILKKQN